MAYSFIGGKFREVDAIGLPLVGGLLYTYAAGTLTLLSTYTDAGGGSANTNPVVLDSSGRADVFLGSANYRIILKSSVGVTIWDEDNISGLSSSFQQSGSGASIRSLQSKLRDSASITDYTGADPTGGSASTAAFVSAEASAFNDIYLPTGSYTLANTTALTKRYYGPGTLTYTGISALAFSGSGLNDATFGGSFIGISTMSLVVKINTTGAPDTLSVSYDGGATFTTTVSTYNPVNDTVTTGPINIVAGPISLAQGVTVTFGATTGHTLAANWSVTCRPTPLRNNTNGNSFSIGSAPFASAFGVQCTQLGIGALSSGSVAGSQNTAVGYGAAAAMHDGYANTSMGAASLGACTTGFFNQAYGASALVSCTSGYQNSANGTYSLYALTTGSTNAAYGVDTMRYCLTGYNNVAMGVQALYQNTAGNDNIGIGLWALRGGSSSTSTGTSCTYNIGVGSQALFQGAGTQNVAVGVTSLYNCTGSQNTAAGGNSGGSITSGIYNVCIGYNAGNNASQAVASQNSVMVGDNAYTTGNNGIAIGSSAIAGANEIVLGNTFNTVLRVATDNTINLGSASKRMATIYAGTGAINTSDGNEKQQFTAHSNAERAVALAIKGNLGKFKFNDAVTREQSGGPSARWHFGAIAQDVAAAFAEHGLDVTHYGLFCSDTWTDEAGKHTRLGLRYDELVAFILGAL